MGYEASSFHGKALDEWLRVRCCGDDDTRWEAIDAVRHICAPDDSIPLLLDTLRNDTYWRARALAAHALYDLSFDSKFRQRLMETVPFVRDALTDSSVEVREQVNELLESLGQEDVDQTRRTRP